MRSAARQFRPKASITRANTRSLVQYTPPLRRKSKVADLIYDDDPAETRQPGRAASSQQFDKALADLEDAIGDVVQLRRMRS